MNVATRVAIVCMWLAVAGLWACVGYAHAARRGGLPPAQLVLARAAVGECGWFMPDCEAGVWHTLQRRHAGVLVVRAARGDRRGYSLTMMFLQYCAVFRGPHAGRNRWVRTLPDRPGGPEGWPRAARWDLHEPYWHRVHLRAGLFLRGLVPDPCDGEPVHTGGIMDRARMNPAKFREVDCGETRRGGREQFFWERR